MLTLFLLALCFCLYTYLVFPLILHLRAVSKLRMDVQEESFSAASEPGECPGAERDLISQLLPEKSVSVVIAAHNEADNLPAKLASLAELSYPEASLECVFVSDGSTDRTVQLLQQACCIHKNWHVFHYDLAAGKPSALNLGVANATGEYIVFMDARQRVSLACIEALLARFSDSTIGAVSGELVLADDNGLEAANVGLYWRYEKWIRMNESALHSTTGATGALYAIRRADYQPLAIDALLDDFDIPISLLRHGKRTVFESDAKAFDQAENSADAEFRRKARTLAGNFQSFARHRWLFNPAQNPVWWQFLSHKVFRLLVPYAMMVALVASMLGEGWFLSLMLVGQLAFYALGIGGIAGIESRLTTVIKVFLQLNAAAVVGAWRALQGNDAIRWKS